MRAVVMRNRQLVVADVPTPEPGPGEVLVRTLACGICGSDLHAFRHAERFVAIDPKPYLADREYDVPTFLWNPRGNQMEDRQQTERRIAAFVAAGLDDFRIRAWTVIRGAYLRPEHAGRIRELVGT